MNEVVLIDSGASFSFIGTELYDELKQKSPEAVHSEISMGGSNLRFTTAAGKAAITPTIYAVNDFHFPRIESGDKRLIRTSIAVLPGLNRRILFGRNGGQHDLDNPIVRLVC